jgi:hypothetical protein
MLYCHCFSTLIWNTHWLLVYAVDVNPLGYNRSAIKKYAEALIDTSKGVDLDVKTENVSTC